MSAATDEYGIKNSAAYKNQAGGVAVAPFPVTDPSPELETVIMNMVYSPGDLALMGALFFVNAAGGWRYGMFAVFSEIRGSLAKSSRNETHGARARAPEPTLASNFVHHRRRDPRADGRNLGTPWRCAAVSTYCCLLSREENGLFTEAVPELFTARRFRGILALLLADELQAHGSQTLVSAPRRSRLWKCGAGSRACPDPRERSP